MPLTLTKTISASPKLVYYMLTNQDGMGYWLADRAYNLIEQDGFILLYLFAERWNAMAEFTQLKPNEAVAYNLRVKGEDKFTTVSYHLESVEGGTKITLSHDGLSDDEEPVYRVEWEKNLRNLHSVLTTGRDTRFDDILFMGASLDFLNEEVAQRLGVPTTEGSLVASIVPHLGAEKAGLRVGDVIVEVSGKPYHPNTTVNDHFDNLKAGDMTDVTFYRGAEKHTVRLTLSAFPTPPPVNSFTELADKVEVNYARWHQHLTELFAGASDEATNTPPKAGEWSANQALAHLIFRERNTQGFLGDFVQEHQIHNFYAFDTGLVRLNTLVKICGNTQGLLNEFKRTYTETVALIREFEYEKFDRPYILWWANLQHSIADRRNAIYFDQIKDSLAKVTN